MKNIFFTSLCLVIFVCATGQSARVLIPYRIGNKWGYSDTLGKIEIPVKYDTAALFDYDITYNGRVIAVLKLNGKPVVINDLGTVLVPAKYDYVTPIQLANDLGFYVTAKNKQGIYANGKEIVPVVYDELWTIAEGYYQAKRNGKWGVINYQGKIVVPVIYDQLWQSGGGSDSLTVNTSANNVAKTYKLKTFTNFSGGRESIPPVVTVQQIELSQRDVEFVKKKYGVDSARVAGYSAIVYKNGKPGIYLPGETQKIYLFSHNYTLQQIKYFPIYERSNWNRSAALIVASSNGKYGLIDETERLVLPFLYDQIDERSEFFLLRQNGKVGFFIPGTFYPAIQPVYDQYLTYLNVPVNSRWSFGLFKVVNSGKVGYVGENGIAFFKN